MASSMQLPWQMERLISHVFEGCGHLNPAHFAGLVGMTEDEVLDLAVAAEPMIGYLPVLYWQGALH